MLLGAYDGTEICELVGTFLLSLIGKKYDSEKIGLYRDDDLNVFRNARGPELEKIKNIQENVRRLFFNETWTSKLLSSLI